MVFVCPAKGTSTHTIDEMNYCCIRYPVVHSMSLQTTYVTKPGTKRNKYIFAAYSHKIVVLTQFIQK